MTWLGWLGLLNDRLFPARWLNDQLRVLERGLRGLLVLGAPRQTPTDATISAPPSDLSGSSSAYRSPTHDTSLANGPDVTGMDANDTFHTRRTRFSLSLKDYGPPNAPSRPVGQTGVTPRFKHLGASGSQGSSKSKDSDLLARLDAVGHALANTESYVARMAQRLVACGLRVRRQVQRPANWAGFAPDPGWARTSESGPRPVPILDSS